MTVITIGMCMFLSRKGQNEEWDHYPLLIKEASLHLFFKRQPKPSWHCHPADWHCPANDQPMLSTQDQSCPVMADLALQLGCSLRL